jgi:hypothetical protein
MNRRQLLKLLASGVVGSTLDVDRLLWVPGAKTIFLPTTQIHRPTESQILALELERIIPHIKELFEKDSVFYQRLESGKVEIAGKNIEFPFSYVEKGKKVTVPLIIKPGDIDWASEE